MAINENKICESYASGKEDTRATYSRASGLEFHYTKKLLNEYIKSDSRVIEIGCATGYYGIHFADKCAEYVGVDISPENITLFNQKIQTAGIINVSASVGDATNLKNASSKSFDVVLCLGPMYHLTPEERELVFTECKRIAKDGAIIVFAYISPMGAYLKGVLIWPEYYPNEKANEYVLKRGVDDNKPDMLFYATPESIAETAKAHGLAVIKNVGTDFTFNDKLINEMSEEQFGAYMTLCDYMVESESCAGLANHGLLISRK
jgi:ubiquinone/menaquinone biosynthesis C-methylase UbiE